MNYDTLKLTYMFITASVYFRYVTGATIIIAIPIRCMK